MVKYLLFLSCVVELVSGVLGDHLDPCPRHRGLADGLRQAENRINGRSLYRLDLRNAIRGYEPNKVYRLRVHTTSKKHKFNDASLMIDPFDSSCGFGRIIIDSDKLYSPKSCPDFVTTQQKEPMGRAHFKWEAPPCGCVHIRIRVHANSSYYIEDEYTQNGPLARTICPKAGTVISTPEPKPKVVVKVLSRAEKLDQLCKLNKEQPVSLLLKGRKFMRNRELSFESEFQKERLEIALEQRQIETEKCCSEASLMMDCFGDVRRRRIDQFCGTGEPDVPFTRSRYDWIKQKQTECCWQIGEDRYHCFNFSIGMERMINDGRNEHSQTVKDLDDFDPANDVDDFDNEDEEKQDVHDLEKEQDENEIVNVKNKQRDPKYEGITKTKKYRGDKKSKSKSKRKQVGDLKEKDDDEDKGDEVKKVNNDGFVVKVDSGDVDDDDDDDDDDADDHDDDDDLEDYEEGDDRKDEKDTPTKVRNLDDKKLTPEECCFNGITAGTKVVHEGMDGCFGMADKFQEIFTNWNRICDRKFVVCCMRVVEGKNNNKNGIGIVNKNTWRTNEIDTVGDQLYTQCLDIVSNKWSINKIPNTRDTNLERNVKHSHFLRKDHLQRNMDRKFKAKFNTNHILNNHTRKQKIRKLRRTMRKKMRENEVIKTIDEDTFLPPDPVIILRGKKLTYIENNKHPQYLKQTSLTHFNTAAPKYHNLYKETISSSLNRGRRKTENKILKPA